jgi:hypothetical protein
LQRLDTARRRPNHHHIPMCQSVRLCSLGCRFPSCRIAAVQSLQRKCWIWSADTAAESVI